MRDYCEEAFLFSVIARHASAAAISHLTLAVAHRDSELPDGWGEWDV